MATLQNNSSNDTLNILTNFLDTDFIPNNNVEFSKSDMENDITFRHLYILEEDYLTLEDFKFLLRHRTDGDRSVYLINKIGKYFLVTMEDSKCYFLNCKKVMYELVGENSNTNKFVGFFTMTILNYVMASKKKVSLNEIANFIFEEKDHGVTMEAYESLSNNHFVNKLRSNILSAREVNVKVFLHDIKYLHFNNGKLDKTTGELKPRKIGEDYINECINRDWTEPTNQHKFRILNALQKVLPDKEVLGYMLYRLAVSITGYSPHFQKMNFCLGEGENGKSFLWELMQKVLGDCYFLKLSPNAFTDSSRQASDKGLASFINRRNALMAVINEVKHNAIESSVFKNVVDGKVDARLLHVDETQCIETRAGIWAFLNGMIRFINGEDQNYCGRSIVRRVIAFMFNSRFIDMPNDEGLEVDDYKHIYAKDANLLSRMQDDDLNAVISLLIPFMKEVFITVNKGNKNDDIGRPIPEALKIAKATVIESCDEWKDFLEQYVNVTGSEADLVHHTKMAKIVNSYFKTKYSTITINKHILPLLKAKGADYNRQKKHLGQVGWYVGIEIISASIPTIAYNCGLPDDDDEDGSEITELKQKIELLTSAEATYKKTLDSRIREIEKLKAEINTLNNNLNKIGYDQLINKMSGHTTISEMIIKRLEEEKKTWHLYYPKEKKPQPLPKQEKKKPSLPKNDIKPLLPKKANLIVDDETEEVINKPIKLTNEEHKTPEEWEEELRRYDDEDGVIIDIYDEEDCKKNL